MRRGSFRSVIYAPAVSTHPIFQKPPAKGFPYQVVKHIVIRPEPRPPQAPQHPRPVLKVHDAPIPRLPPHGAYPPAQPVGALVERHARGGRQPAREVVGRREARYTAAHHGDVLRRGVGGGVVSARPWCSWYPAIVRLGGLWAEEGGG